MIVIMQYLYSWETSMRNNVGPVLLIVIGAFLLLFNLDLLPVGRLKELALTWWPLALVCIGVMQLWKRR